MPSALLLRADFGCVRFGFSGQNFLGGGTLRCRRNTSDLLHARATGFKPVEPLNGLIQSLLVTRRAPKREPFMFPYSPRQTMMLRRFFKLLYGRRSRD